MFATALLGGCEPPEPAGNAGPPPTAESFDAQITKIKNDPNLNAQQKEQAIKGIEMSKQMAGAANDPRNAAGKAPK
ncbi:MAG: hypothetical protein SFX74_11195 [Fimbriimonadaceae bacterium]|nr:hypothetical protein [Fimbriimonadaceae bacterium]